MGAADIRAKYGTVAPSVVPTSSAAEIRNKYSGYEGAYKTYAQAIIEANNEARQKQVKGADLSALPERDRKALDFLTRQERERQKAVVDPQLIRKLIAESQTAPLPDKPLPFFKPENVYAKAIESAPDAATKMAVHEYFLKTDPDYKSGFDAYQSQTRVAEAAQRQKDLTTQSPFLGKIAETVGAGVSGLVSGASSDMFNSPLLNTPEAQSMNLNPRMGSGQTFGEQLQANESLDPIAAGVGRFAGQLAQQVAASGIAKGISAPISELASLSARQANMLSSALTFGGLQGVQGVLNQDDFKTIILKMGAAGLGAGVGKYAQEAFGAAIALDKMIPGSLKWRLLSLVGDELFDVAQTALDPYQLQTYIDNPEMMVRDFLMNVMFQNIDLMKARFPVRQSEIDFIKEYATELREAQDAYKKDPSNKNRAEVKANIEKLKSMISELAEDSPESIEMKTNLTETLDTIGDYIKIDLQRFAGKKAKAIPEVDDGTITEDGSVPQPVSGNTYDTIKINGRRYVVVDRTDNENIVLYSTRGKKSYTTNWELLKTKFDDETADVGSSYIHGSKTVDDLFLQKEQGKKSTYATVQKAMETSGFTERSDQIRKAWEEGKADYTIHKQAPAYARAKSKIDSDIEGAYTEWVAKYSHGGRIKPDDIVLADALLYEFGKNGDIRFDKMLPQIARIRLEAGQVNAAAALYGRMTPEGNLTNHEEMIARINTAGEKRFGDKWRRIGLTSDERARLLNLKAGDAPSTESINAEIEKRIGDELTKSGVDKLDALRSMAMLLNPTTNIRNIVGNGLQAVERKSADVLSTLMQKTMMTGDMAKYRTSAVIIPKDISKVADDFGNRPDVLRLLNASSKFEGTTGRKVFGRTRVDPNTAQKAWAVVDDLANKGTALTYNTMALGDNIFKIPAFKDKLAQIMVARGLNNADQITDEMVQKAKEYAEDAVYQQPSKIASIINKLKTYGGPALVKRNGAIDWGQSAANLTGNALGILVRTVAPFVKTPINITKTGVNYSPVGALKGLAELAVSRPFYNTAKTVEKKAAKAGRTVDIKDADVALAKADEAYDKEVSEAIEKAKAERTVRGENVTDAELREIVKTAKMNARDNWLEKIAKIESTRKLTPEEVQEEIDIRGNRMAKGFEDTAKGLTGTALFVLALELAANSDVITGPPEDDADRAAYERAVGKAPYALHIGNKYYSLEWAQPFMVPVTMAVTIAKQAKDKGLSHDAVIEALGAGGDVVFENPFASGLRVVGKAINPPKGQTAGFASLIEDMTTGYAKQFSSSFLSQIAKTIDPTVRSTYASEEGLVPQGLREFANYIISRTPVASTLLQPKVDVWGRDIVQEGGEGIGGVAGRAALNMLSPGKLTTEDTSRVDKEIAKLFEATKDEKGAKEIFPQIQESYDGTITIDNKEYKMSEKEFHDFQRDMGKKSYSLVKEYMNDPIYQEMSKSEKAEALRKAISYGSSYAKYKLQTKRKDEAKDPIYSREISRTRNGKTTKYPVSEPAWILYNRRAEEYKAQGYTNYTDLAKWDVLHYQLDTWARPEPKMEDK